MRINLRTNVWTLSKRVFIPAHGDCPYQPQWFVSDCHMRPLLDDQTDQAWNPESQTYGGRHRTAWISGERRFQFDIKILKNSLGTETLLWSSHIIMLSMWRSRHFETSHNSCKISCIFVYFLYSSDSTNTWCLIPLSEVCVKITKAMPTF